MYRRKFIRDIGNAGGAVLIGTGTASFVLSEKSSAETTGNTTMHFSSVLADRASDFVATEVKPYNGKPTLFIGGKPCFPMAFISYYPKQFRYKNMWNTGMKFFSLSITLGDGFYGAYRNGKVKLDKKGIWDAPGQIDFNILDQSIGEILAVAPDAYIFPRIYCDAPGWWNSFHPAETNRSYSGVPQRQSFSSTVWREETEDVLRNMVRHIGQSSYAGRVAGMHITAGETEESVHHQWMGPSDYCLAAKKRFRQWLLKKYAQDENLIRSHFDKNSKDIGIPSPAEREGTAGSDFYDPGISRLSIDYQYFRCDEIVESLESFCRAVKEESKGKLFTGVFYGYTLVEWRDHLALNKMIRSPYIDFFSCTNGGGKNTVIGAHDMHFITETDSIQKAGKLFYYEADTRTSMSKWISELQPEIDPYHEYDLPNWLGPDTIEKTTELLKAVFSRVICTGSTNWWFDLWGGWYDHEKTGRQFSEMQKIGNESIHLPRGSVAQLVVFVSEKSLIYNATATRKFTWIGEQMTQIGRLGTPYDIYLIEDLKDLDMSGYKMVIFLDATFMDQDTRQNVRQKCLNNGRSVLWLYAPGLIDEKISAGQVSSLVGMECGISENNQETWVKVTIKGLESEYKGAGLSPFLYIKGGATSIFASSPDGHVLIGEKKEKDFTTILCCVPPVPWQIIQFFTVRAGVHIYSGDGDVVYANQSYLAVSSAKSGKKKIILPGKFQLTELLGNSNVTTFGTEHIFEFQTESCKFFRITEKLG
jgi:beta-galactosidase